MKTLYIDINNKPIENTDEVICFSDKGSLQNDFFYELGCSLLSKSGVNVPKAQLISEFKTSGNDEAYNKIVSQWDSLKTIIFGEEIEGTFEVHLPKEYISWLSTNQNQEYRALCTNKGYDVTKELVITIDVEDFYDEYIDEDFRRSVVKVLKENTDIEQIVFNDDAVTRKSQIVKTIRKEFENLKFIAWENFAHEEDVTDDTGSVDTPPVFNQDNKVLCEYEDSGYDYHTLDTFGNIDNCTVPRWGCFSWSEDSLFKIQGEQVTKICEFDNENEGAHIWGDLLIVEKGWHTPCEIFTKDGNKHPSSGKYCIERSVDKYLFICEISRGNYAVVDIKESKIICALKYPISDKNVCCRYSCSEHLIVFALNDNYEHLEYLNIEDGNSGIIDYNVCYVRKYRNEANPRITVVNDNCLVYSNAETGTDEDKYVIDLNGNILHTYSKYWPQVLDQIVYSTEGGMYNSRSGRTNYYGRPEFRVNEMLLIHERIEKKYYAKLINYENDDLIMDLNRGGALLILNIEDKIRHLYIENNDCAMIFNVDTRQTVEINLPSGSGTLLFTENEKFINLNSSSYDPGWSDEISNGSIILDKHYNVVAEDAWGNYISLVGMPDGMVFYLKCNGEFGRLYSGSEQSITVVKNLSSPILLQPLYVYNKFLIWCKDEVLLINSSGVEESRISLTDVKEYTDIEEINEFSKAVLSYSSFMGLIYEDGKGLILNFSTGKQTTIESCYKIHNDSFKSWKNLVIYGYLHNYDGFSNLPTLDA